MLSPRIELVGLLLVASFALPSKALADEASPPQDNAEPTRWSASARLGYEHLDMSFNAAFSQGPFIGELADHSAVDLNLRHADLWTLGIAGEARRGRLSGSLELKVNLPKNAGVRTASEPFYAGLYPFDWQADNLKWWVLDASAGLDMTDALALQAGLRGEHLSYGLQNPVDPSGLYTQFHTVFGDNYDGELKSSLLIPWIGVRLNKERWHGSLRFSPFARVDMQLPFNYLFVGVPHSTAVIGIERANYSFKNSGDWLEGNLEYELYSARQWRCSLWARASWLRIKGDTSEIYQERFYVNGAQTFSSDAANSAGGTYSSSSYGLGLRVDYAF